MRKYCFFAAVFIIASIAGSLYAEEVTLTTYYPAPYGDYRNIRVAPIDYADRPVCSEDRTGVMYYDDGLNVSSPGEGLYQCDGAAWVPIRGVWQPGAGGDIYYNSGDVGIGTTDPNSSLEVYANDDYSALKVEQTGSGNIANFDRPGGWTVFRIENDGAVTIQAQTAVDDALTITDTDFTNAINIGGNRILGTSSVWDGDGNVGIGTTNPNALLDVNGDLMMSGGDIITDRWVGGHTNVFIGEGVAGAGNLNSFANTAVGAECMYNERGGGYNTAIGYQALYSDGDGAGNIAIGRGALKDCVVGFYNTAVGDRAGENNQLGSNNVFIGGRAGQDNTGSGNVFIGNQAGQNKLSNNTLYIANTNTDTPLIYGNFSNSRVGLGTTAPTHILHVSGVARSSQSTWATSSDGRVKKDITDLTGSLEKLGELRPVTFEYIDEYEEDNETLRGRQVGFIAQEVKEAMPEMVTIAPETVGGTVIEDFHFLNTANLIPMLVDAAKELTRKIADLEAENDELRERISALEQ